MYLIDPRTGEVWLTYRRTGSPNSSPTVQLIAPANGQYVSPGANVRLTASAFDSDGTIASVEFKIDGMSVGFGVRGPNGWYTLDWIAPANGDHQIIALAKDDRGAVAVSPPVLVHVNRSPTVQIIAPADGSSFLQLKVVTLIARAEDQDDSIASVEFFADGARIGSAARVAGTNDFALSWTARQSGNTRFMLWRPILAERPLFPRPSTSPSPVRAARPCVCCLLNIDPGKNYGLEFSSLPPVARKAIP